MRPSWRLLVLCFVALLPAGALAHGRADVPDGIAFSERPGTSLPPSAFLDEDARRVTLTSLAHGRPSLLALGYYRCVDLCSVLLASTRDALARAKLRPGADVDVLVVSIDPHDTPALARARRIEVLGSAQPTGWHFLSGGRDSIDAVANAVGFRYARDDETDGGAEPAFAHPAGLVVIDAAGRVSSYLSGVSFAPDALARSIADARAGEIAPPSALQWLRCFHYDPQTGRYTPVAMNLARVAALASALGVALLLWRRRDRREAR